MWIVIDIPVVAALWTYNGLEPREMEGRIAAPFERATTTTVSAQRTPALARSIAVATAAGCDS
jgi:multidrug efflux pump subunit AcrB